MIKKLKGDHQHLADVEMSRHLQALEKSSAISAEKPRKGHPVLWAIGFIPISQEMRYGLQIRKITHFCQFGQALTQSSWQPLLLLKVTGVIPWIHHTTVKKAVTSCDKDTWKAVLHPKTPSRSSSKDNGPHP